MTFADSEYFLLLLLLIPIFVWYFLFRHRREASLRMATTEGYRRQRPTLRVRLIHLPFFLRVAVFVLLVCCLARPQTHDAPGEKELEGIDIMMAMDISTSMLTPDLLPNRLEAAKAVAENFIASRPHDLVGLTLFGGEAFTQCPLTADHATLTSLLRQTSCDLQAKGVISPGTAIGMGLTNALAHLEHSKSKSKVIILVTDGVNNTGEISPLMAADMAKQQGVRVYTIAIGKSGGKSQQVVAQLPDGEAYTANVDNSADPQTLKEIATTTGGLFYQADTGDKLARIYTDIDGLEKTKSKLIQHDRVYEAYQPFGCAVLLLFVLEILLRLTVWRRLP